VLCERRHKMISGEGSWLWKVLAKCFKWLFGR
jgi:hypothetical protein